MLCTSLLTMQKHMLTFVLPLVQVPHDKHILGAAFAPDACPCRPFARVVSFGSACTAPGFHSRKTQQQQHRVVHRRHKGPPGCTVCHRGQGQDLNHNMAKSA